MIEKQEVIDLVDKAGLTIDFVTYGIACRIGDTIIYNKNLLKYDKLCMEVLDHEIRHSSKFSKKDFLMDLVEGSLLQNLVFSFRHPKAFTHFIPVGRYKGTWWVDINLLLSYLILTMVITMWSFVFL